MHYGLDKYAVSLACVRPEFGSEQPETTNEIDYGIYYRVFKILAQSKNFKKIVISKLSDANNVLHMIFK